MAKALKTAAIIVGVAALVATGVGLAVGAGAVIAAGVTVGTVTTVASVASGVLSIAAGLAAKKPTAGDATGSQTQFAADPDAGIPAGLGRTGTAGNIVARFGWDTADKGDNDRQAFVSVLSLGPVAGIEETLGVDREDVFFDGSGRASGKYAGYMWRMTQRGLLASAALTFGVGAGTPPGWTANHKLSGKAATTWTLRFDTKAALYQNGVPAPMNVLRGRLAYDPRKDSTYPGGSGPHRMADPANRAAYDAAVATWEYTENPYLHALAFVHGYWQRDMASGSSDWQRVMGMGAPDAGIDYAAFVEGANIADANGWKVGGIIYSGDDKWGSLKKILQAGMGEPLALGAKISCLVNAPKVSLATITVDDVVGDCSVGATQPRRDRINTITPRYRLEANNWQLLPGAPLTVPEYVVADRGKRSKTQDYPLIQTSPQVGTAVRYDIENAREFGPIVLPCKLVWMGYKPGDCVTANLPEVGLNNQTILLLNRELEPSGGIVTLTARSETPGKHAFALGQTSTPPPTPGVTGAPVVPVPSDGAWTISGTSIQSDGVTMPALVVTGATDASTAQSVVFEYRQFASGQDADAGWTAAGSETPDATRKVIPGVASATAYEVSVRYFARGIVGGRRVLGPVTTAAYQGVAGKDGLNGKDGAPGTKGADGQTSYVHYAYANSPDGRVDFDLNQPAGRAYEGSYTDFIAADSSDPAAYIWREYKGPPFGMAARGAAVVAANSLIKRPGVTADWDSDGYSTSGYVNGAVAAFSFAPGTYAMAGLNTDPTADASYASLDFAWYQEGNNVHIYESGGYVLKAFEGADASYVYRVEYDGRFVKYFVNQNGPYRTVDVGAGKLFYFDSSINTPGGRINNVAFTARGANGADGRDGLDGTNGVNGRDGTNGASSFVHLAYANSADGSVDFTTGAVGGRSFVGIYRDQTEADSGDYHAYSWSRLRGIDGTNGKDGTPGNPGADGRTPYTHFAYATSADGSANFSTDDPSGRTYLGVYTDYVVADSGDYHVYTWSLIKGVDGTNGQPGADAYSVTLSQSAIILRATADGTIKGGELPRTFGLKVMRGGVDVTNGASVTMASSDAAITAGYGNGTVSLTGAAAGWLDVSVSYGGLALGTYRVTITVQRDPPAPASQTSAAQALYANTTSTSYDGSGASQSLLMKANGNGQITAGAYGEYYAEGGTGNYIMRYAGKLQYRAGGGSWADAQAEVTGTTATTRSTGDSTPGSLSLSATIGGLSSGTTYEVRAIYRKVSGAANVSGAINGDMSAQQ